MNNALSQSIDLFRSPAVLEQILRGCPLFRGVPPVDLARVIAAAQVVSRSRGDVIAGENEPSASLFLLLRGRVQIDSIPAGGGSRPLGQLGPGDHFGELGLLTGARLALRTTAVTDVLLVQLGRATFEALMRTLPVFAENLSRALGLRLSSQNSGRPTRTLPGIVGLAGAGPRAATLLATLGQALVARGAPLAIVTEGRFEVAGAACTTYDLLLGLEHGLLPDDRLGSGHLPASDSPSGGGVERGALVQRVAALRSTHDLVLLTLDASAGAGPEDPRLVPCEELWWIVEPQNAPAALAVLDQWLLRKPTLASRTRIVWALAEGERPLRGARPQLLLAPEYRVFLPEQGEPGTRRQKQSLRRLVGCLEGLRVGLALGGGGARGLAHCGVLRVFDDVGIAVDRIAGTSIGALVGLLYAAGTEAQQVLAEISREACASPLMRLLPKGRYLNMVWKARTGAFERSIRKHYDRIRFEELDFPLQTVTADLVRGESVVRHSGDCVDAVIESLNLPIFASPILREGRALVDGGILNNLPSDLLVADEVEVVVAVDVMSRALEKAGSGASGGPVRKPGLFESLARIAELQHESLSQHGAGRADLVLRVHAENYSLVDFSQKLAPEIALTGEIAARESLESLQSLIPHHWRGRDA